jgi:hypothetical protein
MGSSTKFSLDARPPRSRKVLTRFIIPSYPVAWKHSFLSPVFSAHPVHCLTFPIQRRPVIFLHRQDIIGPDTEQARIVQWMH